MSLTPPKPALSWKDFVSQMKAANLLAPGFVVRSVKSTDSLPSVLKCLKEWHVSSAPVWDEGEEKFIGMIDMADIAATVSMVIEAKVDAIERDAFDWDDKDLVKHQNIREIMDISELDPWFSIYDNHPFDGVLHLLATSADIHRLPVFSSVLEEDDKLVGILTQSRAVEFIQKHASFWADSAEFKAITADSLLSGKSDNLRKNVESCLASDPTWKAFRQISHKEISALAVKNNDGRLIGSLSVTDLQRSTESDLLKDMFLPVGEYIRSHPILFTCKKSTPLIEIMSEVVGNSIHRVFVVDDHEEAIGVLALCDLLTPFASQQNA